MVRLAGLERWPHIVAPLALTPYALGGVVLLTGLAAVARRAVVALVAGALAVVLTAVVLPRALPDAQPSADGHTLVVASANLYHGRGAVGAVVDMVRDRRVDVLSLQELTPQAVRALDAAGLAQLLPYRVFREQGGGSGSGLASRFPLQPRDLTPPSVHQQPGALVDLPGSRDLEVLAVHTVPPLGMGDTPGWRRELGELPPARADDTIRLLVGDFNATLDHPGLRRLLADGYADAADEVGAGLRPTWPSASLWPPKVTIDHVLVDRRCAVRWFDVVDVPGTDHRAIVAEVACP